MLPLTVLQYCTASLFADDCIIYRPIICKKDAKLIQSDLNSLVSWEKTCLMQFNADKCFTMRAGRSKNKINASYKLHDQPLQRTDSVKYLGLTLTSDLKFNSHSNNVTAKAISVLGFLRRNLKISLLVVKTQAYQSLVRPHLEYASTVWNPHTSDNTSCVSEMISHLSWESLAVRHSYRRLHTMYRIVNTTMGDPWQRWLTLYPPVQTNTRVPSVEVYSTEPVK